MGSFKKNEEPQSTIESLAREQVEYIISESLMVEAPSTDTREDIVRKKFAFDSLKKFKPHSIFDMSLVTACIRPSGASYREELLSHQTHKNPSEIIDNLLKDNLGFLVYQCDTIKFLQQICGLSGSEADNIRRAIGIVFAA